MNKNIFLQIQELSKNIANSWRMSRGIAPDTVANKMDLAMFDWMCELTDALEIWINKGCSMSDGELILARTNLGSLVEFWLRFFYCVYYEDYIKNPFAKKGKVLDPDDRDMSFEYLKQHSLGILWDDTQDPVCQWVEKIQHYRNAIHSFRFRAIGTPNDFLFDIEKYLEFIEMIIGRLPPIEEYRIELLSDCY